MNGTRSARAPPPPNTRGFSSVLSLPSSVPGSESLSPQCASLPPSKSCKNHSLGLCCLNTAKSPLGEGVQEWLPGRTLQAASVGEPPISFLPSFW